MTELWIKNKFGGNIEDPGFKSKYPWKRRRTEVEMGLLGRVQSSLTRTARRSGLVLIGRPGSAPHCYTVSDSRSETVEATLSRRQDGAARAGKPCGSLCGGLRIQGQHDVTALRA